MRAGWWTFQDKVYKERARDSGRGGKIEGKSDRDRGKIEGKGDRDRGKIEGKRDRDRGKIEYK